MEGSSGSEAWTSLSVVVEKEGIRMPRMGVIEMGYKVSEYFIYFSYCNSNITVLLMDFSVLSPPLFVLGLASIPRLGAVALAREDEPFSLLVRGSTNEGMAFVESPIVDTGIDLVRLVERVKRDGLVVLWRDSVCWSDCGTGFAEKLRGR